MADSLKVVIIQGSDSDVDSLKEVLRNSNIYFKIKVVSSKSTYNNALKDFIPDLIIAGSQFPRFTVNDLLKLSSPLSIPFVVISNSGDETSAAELISEGVKKVFRYKDINQFAKWLEKFLKKTDSSSVVKGKLNTEDQSDKIYTSLLESLLDGVCIVDNELNVVEANNSYLVMTGFSKGELLNKNFPELLLNVDKKLFAKFNSPYKKNSQKKFNATHIRKDGTSLPVEVSSTFLVGKRYKFLFIIRDISEQVSYRKELAKKEFQLSTTISDSPIVLYSIDQNGIFTLSEGKGLKTLGLEPAQAVGLSVHDVYKDAPSILENVKEALEGKIVESTEVVGDKVLFAKYNPLFDENGNSRGLTGTAFDITEEYNSEKFLRESEDRFMQIFNTSIDSISINTLDDGRYIEVNKGFETHTGFKREEIIGKTADEIGIWEDSNDRTELIKQLKSDGNVKNYQTKFRRKDGEVRFASSSASIIELRGVKCRLSIHRDITDKIKAEEIVRQSEEMYRMIAENTDDVIWKLDPITQKYTDISPSIIKLRGLTVEEAMKETLQDSLTPDSYEKATRRLMVGISEFIQSPENQIVVTDEFQQPCKNGEVIWVEVVTKILKNEKGELGEIIGISRDITERKKSEEALKESEGKYRRFVEQSREGIFRMELNPPISMNLSNEEKAELLYEKVVISHCNSTFANMYGFDDPAEMIGKKFTYWAGNKNKVIEILAKWFETDFNADDVETAEVDKDGNPVYFLNNTFGVLKDGYLYEIWGTQRNITQKKKDDEQIKLQASLLDSASDAIYLYEIDGSIIYTNQAASTMLGYSQSEFLQMKIPQINSFESAEVLGYKLSTLLTPNELNTETTHQRKDGSSLPVEIKAQVINLNNKTYVLSFVRDITERKGIENNLKYSEEKFSKVFHISADAFVIYRLDDKTIVEVNKGFELLSGYSANEVIGKNILDTTIWKLLEDWDDYVNALETNGEYPTSEKVIVSKTGNISYTLFSTKVFSIGSEKFVLTNIKDLTEKFFAAEETKRNKQYLEAIFGSVNEAIFIVDIQTKKIIDVNSKAVSILGYSKNELLEMTFLSLCSNDEPYDEKNAILKFKNALERQNQLFEWHARSKSGENIWVEVDLKVTTLDNFKRVIISARDISDKKQVQEKIRKSEEQNAILAASLHSSPLALIYWKIEDNKVSIKDWNSTSERLFGFSKNEIINRNFSEDNNLPDGIEQIRLLLQSFEEKEFPKNISLEIRTKAEEPRLITWFNTPLIDEYNKTVTILSLGDDMTEIRKSEMLIKESEERYRKLVENSPVAIFIHNNGNVLYTNKACLTMFGAEDTSQVIGINLYDYMHPDYHQISYNRIKLISEGVEQLPPAELKFHKLNGDLIEVSTSAIKIEYHGQTAIMVVATDITDLKKAEEQIRESEERYRNLFEFSPEPIYVYSDDEIQYANSATASLLGVNEPQELYGRSIFDFIHPDSIESARIRNRQMELGETKLPLVEHKYLRFDGKIIHVEVSSIIFISNNVKSVQVVLRDVTDRKNSEIELRRLSSAVEQSPAAIILTDTNGIISYTNPKFSEITGYTFDEVIGKNVSFLNAGIKINQDYKNLWETISAGQEWRGEFLNRKKSGETYWELASISPIRNQRGDLTGYLAIKEDITDRKKIEEALIESKLEAEEANKLKSSLLANVSHEFRTPLNGILGFSQLLSEELTEPEFVEMSQKITRSGKRLMNTLNSVLMITELENNEYLISKTETDLGFFCQQLVTMYEKTARDKNLKISFSIPDYAVMATLDESLLTKSVSHIVENAIKYTYYGEVNIVLGTKYSYDNRLQAFIKINDSGIGIKKEDQKIIFREFKQLSEGFRRDYEGLGLGLSLSKRMINLIGGDLEVESEIGKGSCFTVTLNNDINIINQEQSAQEFIIPEEDQEYEVSDQSNRPNVLLIEDNPVNIEVVKRFLNKVCEVESARDGQTGIDKALKGLFEIIMLDINLGQGMDGIQVMQELKKHDKFSSIPFIAITGYASNVNRRDFLSQGFTHYLAKPFEKRELLKLVNEIISK